MRALSKYQLFSFIFIALLFSGCANKARTQKVDATLNTARSYIGTPYKYGGTTRAGIDCSALLYHSYRSAQVNLPRTAKEQSKQGKKVSKRDIQVGDMLFFATGKKKNEITHAGIVTYAKGKEVRFLHASTSLGVIESSLSSDYYKKRFRKARRVL